MKKTVKTPKKTVPQKKKNQNSKKNPPKKAKTRSRSAKKKVSASFKTTSLRAFQLAGLLVVLSACVSLAVLSVHSSKNDSEENIVRDSEPVPVINIEAEVEPITQPAQEAEPTVAVSTPAGLPVAAARQPKPPQRPPERTPERQPERQPERRPEREPERVVENLGTLVFVIDDAGNKLRDLEPFLQIPGPLTIAVLPGLPHSAEAARRIRAAGKEVILHQPMEAIGGQNPGPGAIYSGMSAEEIREILLRNIEEVGPVTGMNNHQGSKITMDREIMEIVLAFCAEHGIYFLDSRTTAESVVPSVARQLGFNITQRDVFIDNEQDKEMMLRFITSGLARAQRSGRVVMIGHVWSADLAPLLAEKFPQFIEQGYTIRAAFDIINAR